MSLKNFRCGKELYCKVTCTLDCYKVLLIKLTV